MTAVAVEKYVRNHDIAWADWNVGTQAFTLAWDIELTQTLEQTAPLIVFHRAVKMRFQIIRTNLRPLGYHLATHCCRLPRRLHPPPSGSSFL
jgi:hypothetical protein